jgi:hypothetical protein
MNPSHRGGFPEIERLTAGTRIAETRVAIDKRLKVFISYSRKDFVFAQRIVVALESRGLTPKIDTRELPKLEDWRRELLGLIRDADAVVFVISPNSISSPVCSWEVDQVRQLNKRLAPIVYEAVAADRIPDAVAKINYLSFDGSSDFETQADALAQALQTDLVWVKEHARLGELARRWNERRRGRGYVLRGQELLEAERWIALRPRNAPEPTALHREFIAHYFVEGPLAYSALNPWPVSHRVTPPARSSSFLSPTKPRAHGRGRFWSYRSAAVA